ncbi:MAG: hypothetical protein ACNA8G_05025 [Gammaproteobacteria bacterium]
MRHRGLALLLLLAAPLAAGQEPPAKAGPAGEPVAEQAEEAAQAAAPAAPAGSPAAAETAEAEERFVPTEKVPADASISFPVDI